MTKLNLASGQMYLDGYINIDNKSMYSAQMKVDLQADIFNLTWKNSTVNEILLSHFAMYISLQDMHILLARWYDWLVPGGSIIIETGNVKNIARLILESEDPSEINGPNGVMQLFGWETTSGHKWAWCPETLGQILLQSGFSDLQVGPGYFHGNEQRDFLIKAIKN